MSSSETLSKSSVFHDMKTEHFSLLVPRDAYLLEALPTKLKLIGFCAFAVNLEMASLTFSANYLQYPR